MKHNKTMNLSFIYLDTALHGVLNYGAQFY